MFRGSQAESVGTADFTGKFHEIAYLVKNIPRRKLSMPPVHVTSKARKSCIAEFSSVTEALIWKQERDFLKGFDIVDRRDMSDPGRLEDMPLLIAAALREAITPVARKMQYSRLLSGEIPALPKDDMQGLEGIASIFGALCLDEAGAPGWSAVSGGYHRPQTLLDLRGEAEAAPIPHIWIAHESGAVIDLSRKVFTRLPVTVLTPEEASRSGLVGEDTFLPHACCLEASRWMNEVGTQVVPRIRFMGASRLFLQERAISDPAIPDL